MRAHSSGQGASARVGAAALVVLLAGLVLGRATLVPVAIVLACGGYAGELAIDDAPLDASAPILAAAALVVAELAYWSIEERERLPTDSGEHARRAAFVAVLGVGALLVGGLVLALVDAVHTRSLALDVTGAIAAAAALLVIRLAGRTRGT